MKNHLSSAAFAAALLISAVCAAEEFPFSPSAAASGSFSGPVPTIAELPLGMSYDAAKARFEEMRSTFSVSAGSRDLQLGSTSDGTVSFSYPETLHAKGAAGTEPFKEERKAVFSSPLSGSQLVMIERDFSLGSDELSIPEFQSAIEAALGKPTATGGGPNADIPKLVYAWIDGKLVSPDDVPNLETTPSAWLYPKMDRRDALNATEQKIGRCSDLSDATRNDPLIDTVNALAKGRDVPEHCTAMATVMFYTGSQTDLSRRIVVTVAYTGAIVEDAKKVRSFMTEALASGAGRKSGVGIGKL